MFRIRIELAETPVWRLVDIRSDIRLDVLHDVVQVTTGWTNSHLHQFSRTVGGTTEDYLMQSSIDEGDVDGVPEVEVRLDEVLDGPGDVLHYQYDFGDNWRHTLTVEAVLPAVTSVAVCIDGAQACPPEDCGGIGGYQELLEALADPTAAEPDLLSWMGEWQPHAFDVGEANAALDRWALLPDGLNSLADPTYLLPPTLAELVSRIRNSAAQWDVADLARSAGLDAEPEIDETTAAEMVRPYQWLLDRVGPDGLVSTPNGYLKPVDVRACATELGFKGLGPQNRENQTPQVHQLRQSAQRLGLLRKLHGRFVLTVTGKKLAGDPVALWTYLAAKIPTGDKAAQDAGRIALLLAANGLAPSSEAIHEPMMALGWGYSPTAPITDSDAYALARPTIDVLRLVGAAAKFWPAEDEPPHPVGGKAFARAALRG